MPSSRTFRRVEDHEEWLKLAADSDSGIHVMQGFLVHDDTMKRPVTEERVVELKGWDEQLTGVTGPMKAHIPLDGDVPLDQPADSYYIDLSTQGFWWIYVPVDYLDQVGNSRLEFRIRQGSSELVFKAYEAFVKRYDVELRIDEFNHTVEHATKDGVYICTTPTTPPADDLP